MSAGWALQYCRGLPEVDGESQDWQRAGGVRRYRASGRDWFEFNREPNGDTIGHASTHPSGYALPL